MAERFEIKVRNPGLGRYRVISGKDPRVVHAKAQALSDAWAVAEQVQLGVRDAEARTKEAKIRLEEIQNILRSALQLKPKITWQQIIKPYLIRKPTTKKQPQPPIYATPPAKPEILTEPAPLIYLEYPVEPNIIHKIDSFSGTDFGRAYSNWQKSVKKIELANEINYNERVAAVEKWNSPEDQLKREQAQKNGLKLLSRLNPTTSASKIITRLRPNAGKNIQKLWSNGMRRASNTKIMRLSD